MDNENCDFGGSRPNHGISCIYLLKIQLIQLPILSGYCRYEKSPKGKYDIPFSVQIIQFPSL